MPQNQNLTKESQLLLQLALKGKDIMSKRICTMVLGTMLVIPNFISAQGSTNLLKNSELKVTNNQLNPWSVTCKFKQDVGYKNQNSISMTLSNASPTVLKGKAVMLQQVKNLKPGKYILSAYIKLDRKISDIVLVRIIRLDGIDVYQATNLKTPEQAEPGVWSKVMAEFDIPEGTTSAMFAFDLRDESPGATVCLDSPVLTYNAE